ncbi:MAG: hypothetical protein AAGA18_08570 [Verrucomicrobiota bacterium]
MGKSTWIFLWALTVNSAVGQIEEPEPNTIPPEEIQEITLPPALSPPSIKIKPIQIVSASPIPKDLQDPDKPIGHQEGLQIYYLLEGKNLVGINKDSFKLDFLTMAGKEDFLEQQGRNLTHVSIIYTKFSEDKKYGIFALHIPCDKFYSKPDISFRGSAKILSSESPETASILLSMESNEKKRVGPFEIEKNGANASFFGISLDAKKGLGIKLQGPIEILSKIEVLDGKKPLSISGGIYENGGKTFFYRLPKAENVKVVCHYWSNAQEIPVIINY